MITGGVPNSEREKSQWKKKNLNQIYKKKNPSLSPSQTTK